VENIYIKKKLAIIKTFKLHYCYILVVFCRLVETNFTRKKYSAIIQLLNISLNPTSSQIFFYPSKASLSKNELAMFSS